MEGSVYAVSDSKMLGGGMQTDVERISIYSASVFVLVSGNVGGDWRVRGLEHRVVIEAGEELKTWARGFLGLQSGKDSRP